MVEVRGRYAFVLACAALLQTVSTRRVLLQQDDFSFDFTSLDALQNFPRRSDSILSKRDVCTDTFAGTVSQTCTPGNTLCCVPANASIAYPQCQTLFGEGFCCVALDGACYVDTQSDCGATGAVQCSELGPGVSEACCPEFTQCPGNFNQSTDDTRCQFTPSASTSTTTSTASSSTSSTTTSTAITTSTSISLATTAVSQTVVTSPTSQPINSASTPSNSLSAGADAGIAVVSTLAVIAVAGAAFWMWRKRAKRQNHSASAYHKADAAHNLGKPPDNNFIDRENYGKHELPDDHRNELPAEQHELLEFPTGREAQELPTSEYGSDSDRRR